MEQSIIDYINQSKIAGVSDEQIRQSLISSGWSNKDVDDATQFIENNNSNSTKIKTTNNSLRNWIIIGFIITALICSIYLVLAKNYNLWPFQSSQDITTDKSESPSPSPSPNLEAEVQKAFVALTKITTDAELRNNLSSNSFDLFDQFGETSDSNGFANYIFKSVDISSDRRHAIVLATQTDQDGDNSEEILPFVLENEKWKFNFPAAIEELNKQIELEVNKLFPENPTPVPSSSKIDLQVLDFIPSPNPPKAGDSSTKIEARIKNIGTTEINGFDYTMSINGFSMPGQLAESIKPGETVRVDSYWYYLISKKYTPELRTDPGIYEFKIVVDPNNVLKDANVSNNTLTQNITMN